ncbi:MAG: cytochrome C [Gammaproteobacteria bacterium]|nr:cytochrome C [Gammaproteobacteria bacterium]
MIKQVVLVCLILSTACFNIFLATIIFVTTSFATTNNHPLENIVFSQDPASLQRGAMIYYDVCRICHSMKYIRYKTLQEIGLSNKQIDTLRGDKPENSTPEKTTSDHMLSTLYGQVPPDLSLMAKARKHGPQYIYTLLTSYTENEGKYENPVFPGIKMPDAMNIAVAINESSKEEIKNQAKDVTEFLLWASDPRASIRKKIGLYVIIYFSILSILLYFVMKRVWSRLDNVES